MGPSLHGKSLRVGRTGEVALCRSSANRRAHHVDVDLNSGWEPLDFCLATWANCSFALGYMHSK